MLETLPPIYVYNQYANNDAVRRALAVINAYCQDIFTTIQNANLPLWDEYTGADLDALGVGVYGIARPQNQSDAYYRLVLEWYMYRGDGVIPSFYMISRKIARFMGIDRTLVHITANSSQVTITFPTGGRGMTLKNFIDAGICPLPMYRKPVVVTLT